MKKESRKILGMLVRYFSIVLLGLGNLYVIYKLLTPLTIGVLSFILSIFTDVITNGNFFLLDSLTIEIVPACVAGSAFYLLLILILSSADIKPGIRTKAIMTSFVMLFALNVTRILILIPLSGTLYFETIHWVFWHLVSTVFVVAVWLGVVRMYGVKSVPIYSDLKYVRNLIYPVKKSKRKKKHQ